MNLGGIFMTKEQQEELDNELDVFEDIYSDETICSEEEMKNNVIDSTTFDDILGYEEIKNQLYLSLGFIKDPSSYTNLGCKPPKGILLHGLPGVGKTMLASAFINASSLKSYIVKRLMDDKEFVEYLSSTFQLARKNQPCIIFLDDLDKFSKDNEDKKVFNILQSLIDSIKNEKIYIIATANFLYKLPDSLIREGRFDTSIDVKTDEKTYEKIIRESLKRIKLSNDINVDDIIAMSSLTSPVSIKNTINKTCMLAARNKQDEITMDNFVSIFSNIVEEDDWKEDERLKEIAFHEAGHAVVQEAIKQCSIGFVTVKFNRVSCERGYTKSRVFIDSRQAFLLIALAGKVSVELNLPLTASGCANDIESAMSAVNALLTIHGEYSYQYLKYQGNDSPISDKQVTIEAFLMSIYEKYVKRILLQNKALLLAMVDVLLDKGYLLNSDIKNLEEKHPLVPFDINSII